MAVLGAVSSDRPARLPRGRSALPTVLHPVACSVSESNIAASRIESCMSNRAQRRGCLCLKLTVMCMADFS